MVVNEYGKRIDFAAAEALMDESICEELNASMAPCSEQAFFDAYCRAHEAKYGEPFEPAKENPVF